jgi:hypothetical protein
MVIYLTFQHLTATSHVWLARLDSEIGRKLLKAYHIT